jgi:hypothetical protein
MPARPTGVLLHVQQHQQHFKEHEFGEIRRNLGLVKPQI